MWCVVWQLLLAALAVAETGPSAETTWYQFNAMENTKYYFNPDSREAVWTEPPSAIVLPATQMLQVYGHLSEDGAQLDIKTSILKASRRPATDDVTLVVQCDMDRLHRVVNQADLWQGPVVASVLVKEGELDALKDWVNSAPESVKTNVDMHAAVVKEIPKFYPINKMRNVALHHVQSDYVQMLDIDESTVQDHSHYKNEIKTGISRMGSADKVAFVSPSFRWTDKPETPPKDKEELRRLFEQGKLAIKAPEYEPAYTLPGMTTQEWLDIKEVTPLGYHDGFEPYYAAKAKGLPDFDPRFSGFGGNYVVQTFTMATEGYLFVALPGAFTLDDDEPSSHKTKKSPPNNPELCAQAWADIGRRRGCDTCDIWNCVKNCPNVVPSDKGPPGFSMMNGPATAAFVTVKTDIPGTDTVADTIQATSAPGFATALQPAM